MSVKQAMNALLAIITFYKKFPANGTMFHGRNWQLLRKKNIDHKSYIWILPNTSLNLIYDTSASLHIMLYNYIDVHYQSSNLIEL